MPRVTVLLPVRDGARYIDAAMRSILRQSYRDFELLTVDDGSTDRTSEIVAHIAATDPRVRLVKREPAGLVDTLNYGLSKSDCEYVARMDADDIAFPGRLGRQVEAFNERPQLAVCGGDYLVFGAQHVYGRPPRSDGACKARLLLFPCFLHSATMLRRSILERTGIAYRREYPHCEDYQLWSELAPHGMFANLPRLLMRYRSHAAQVSVAHRRLQRDTHVRISAANLRAAGIHDISEQALRRFLWPRDALAAGAKFSPAAYAREALALLQRLRRAAGPYGSRFAITLSIRIARNLAMHDA